LYVVFPISTIWVGVCIEVECVDGLVISGTRTVIDGCMRFEVYVKVRNEMMAMKSSVWGCCCVDEERNI